MIDCSLEQEKYDTEESDDELRNTLQVTNKVANEVGNVKKKCSKVGKITPQGNMVLFIRNYV